MNKRRITSKIDKLEPELKDMVDKMLLSGNAYREIISQLAEHGVDIGKSSVSRYAKRFLTSAQQLRIAQENFRMILTETERYPDLDPAEAILRLASQRIFEAITNREDLSPEEMSTEQLYKEVVALSRAVTYKKKIDIGTKSKKRLALEEQQTSLFEHLKANNPKLYTELAAEIQNLIQEEKQNN